MALARKGLDRMELYKPNLIRARRYDIFVSYKREEDEARAELVRGLEAAGYDVFWDGKLNHDDWKNELRDEINRSTAVICLWSASAAASKNVLAEAFHAFGIEKLLSAPIESMSVVPDYFKNANLHPFDGWADATRRDAQISRILATLERMTGGPTGKTKALEAPIVIPVEFGDIPGAPRRLIGRDKELSMLRAAWESRAPKKTNAVVLHALGGAGKSALLRAFANELLAAGGGGAQRIYGWSAYSQGSGEQKRADADGFISKALGDLGFQGDLPKDPIERARALARLIQRERMLLLLDGLEPLLNQPGVNRGCFKDKGLSELVRALASSNAGLIVLTTRQEVPELEGFGELVINHPLDVLSDTAGADLLVELGVRGRQRELEAAVRSVEGHALSVTLLGAYIAEVCGGDIRHRDQFDFADVVLTQAEREDLATDKSIIPAKRAAKIMQGYLDRFDKLAKSNEGIGGPERTLLKLLGLFDRPADGKAFAALLEKRIPGLTDELFVDAIVTWKGLFGFGRRTTLRELSEDERRRRIHRAKGRLRKLRLLTKPNPAESQEMDAHPIVRAFFSGQLEQAAPEPAKIAHDILYRHYSATAPDLPDTLEEMRPLFHAVQHGVKAGRLQEAYDELLRRRIRRSPEEYIYRVLAAFGPFLEVTANFFDKRWHLPRRELLPAPATQAWLLNTVAFTLAALGRPTDSLEPRRASLEAFVADKQWASAAIVGGGLSDTLLKLGRVREAVSVAKAAVAHADRCDDEKQRGFRRTDLAGTLTAAGDFAAAAVQFAEAELILEDSLKPAQSSVRQDYRHGHLMLLRGDADEALSRGRYQLDIAEQFLGRSKGLHNIGLGHLLIGRAEDALNLPGAATSLDAAVSGLRKSGMTDLLPLALLARTAHRRKRVGVGDKNLIQAILKDLSEVEDIAANEMNLHLTDLALERARLAFEVPFVFDNSASAQAEARAQTVKASNLISETGYHCHDDELAILRNRLSVS